jgi:glycopeptide antibiotics resistance protein
MGSRLLAVQAFERLRYRLERLGLWPSLAAVLLVAWGLFIVYATTLPFDFSASNEQVTARLRLMWESPLRVRGRADAIGNVLLFVPWGFLLAIWEHRRGVVFVRGLVTSLLSAAVLSGSVEFTQLFAPTRFASVLDVATNTLGSVAGFLVGWPAARWIRPVALIRIRQVIELRPMAGCALAAAAGLVIATVAGDLKFAFPKASAVPLASPGGAWPWVGELLAWTLFGGLFFLAARESGWRGTWGVGWTVALCGGARVAVELLQVMITHFAFDVVSVSVSIVGAAIGVATVARSPAGGARRWIRPALVIWGMATIMWAWDLSRFTWPASPGWQIAWFVPFWSYFESRSLSDLSDLIEEVVIFVPLGALLGAQSWRTSLAGASLIGLGLGAVLEIGQLFIDGRSVDLTDALSAGAGAGLGLALWRWGESLRRSHEGAARYRVRA